MKKRCKKKNRINLDGIDDREQKTIGLQQRQEKEIRGRARFGYAMREARRTKQ